MLKMKKKTEHYEKMFKIETLRNVVPYIYIYTPYSISMRKVSREFMVN